MNFPKHLLLTLALAAPLPLAGCSDAVVGRENNPLSPNSTIELCEELGREICQKACDCTVGERCIVSNGESGGIVYDNQEDCEGSFITLACLNPPNSDNYYQDCLDAIVSCEEQIVGGQSEQAAAIPPACRNPNGFGIACGDDRCTRTPTENPDNQVCCVSIDGDMSTPSCQAPELSCDGPSLALSRACDGPEDCGGTACCGTVVQGIACTDLAECPEDVGQYCHTNLDCPTGEICVQSTLAGFALHTCVLFQL